MGESNKSKLNIKPLTLIFAFVFALLALLYTPQSSAVALADDEDYYEWGDNVTTVVDFNATDALLRVNTVDLDVLASDEEGDSGIPIEMKLTVKTVESGISESFQKQINEHRLLTVIDVGVTKTTQNVQTDLTSVPEKWYEPEYVTQEGEFRKEPLKIILTFSDEYADKTNYYVLREIDGRIESLSENDGLTEYCTISSKVPIVCLYITEFGRYAITYRVGPPTDWLLLIIFFCLIIIAIIGFMCFVVVHNRRAALGRNVSVKAIEPQVEQSVDTKSKRDNSPDYVYDEDENDKG